MSLAYILGAATGFAVVFIIFTIVAVICKKKRQASAAGRMGQDYDERQLQARGKAYRAAYFSLIICVLAEVCADAFLDKKLFTSMVGLGLAMLLSAGVFAVICILNDAYLRLYDKAKETLCTLSIIGVINLILTVRVFIGEEKLIEDGELSYIVLNMGIVFLYVIVLTVFAIKLRINNKAEKE
ncbi:MAG: hypothetical protein ACI4EF_04020 [Coprococcus sp.]